MKFFAFFCPATSGLLDPQPLMNGYRGLFPVFPRRLGFSTCLKSVFSGVNHDPSPKLHPACLPLQTAPWVLVAPRPAGSLCEMTSASLAGSSLGPAVPSPGRPLTSTIQQVLKTHLPLRICSSWLSDLYRSPHHPPSHSTRKPAHLQPRTEILWHYLLKWSRTLPFCFLLVRTVEELLCSLASNLPPL